MRKTILWILFACLALSLCSCGNSQSDLVSEFQSTLPEIPKTELFTIKPICSEHSFGDWETVVTATAISEGLMSRRCTNCFFSETKKIPKIAFSYYMENGNKAFEAQLPYDIENSSSDYAHSDSFETVKIIINEAEKTITVEGEALPPNISIDDIKSNIRQTLEDNGILVNPDFEFDIQIPQNEETQGAIPW